MSRPRGDAPMPSILALRTAAASVVALCNAALLSEGYARRTALAELPGALRRLRFRATRALTALESEDQP